MGQNEGAWAVGTHNSSKRQDLSDLIYLSSFLCGKWQVSRDIKGSVNYLLYSPHGLQGVARL